MAVMPGRITKGLIEKYKRKGRLLDAQVLYQRYLLHKESLTGEVRRGLHNQRIKKYLREHPDKARRYRKTWYNNRKKTGRGIHS